MFNYLSASTATIPQTRVIYRQLIGPIYMAYFVVISVEEL
jgi:hypothetical protein